MCTDNYRSVADKAGWSGSALTQCVPQVRFCAYFTPCIYWHKGQRSLKYSLKVFDVMTNCMGSEFSWTYLQMWCCARVSQASTLDTRTLTLWSSERTQRGSTVAWSMRECQVTHELQAEIYPWHSSVGVVESLKIVTREKSQRIAKYAFDYATHHQRKRVTAIHKANIM